MSVTDSFKSRVRSNAYKISFHLCQRKKNEDVAKMSGRIYTKQRLSLEGRFEKEVYALSYAFSRSCGFFKQLYIIFVLRKQKIYPQKNK